jgi:radical SAM protein with 4Fe4S-binding SPASM domain
LNYDVAPLGSYKENSFDEIWGKRWDNPLFQARNREKSQCNSCKYNTFCDGGCKAEAYKNFGSINVPSVSCIACN